MNKEFFKDYRFLGKQLKVHYLLLITLAVPLIILLLSAFIPTVFGGADDDVGFKAMPLGYFAVLGIIIPIITARNLFNKYYVMTSLPVKVDNIIKSAYLTTEAGTVLYILATGLTYIFSAGMPKELILLLPVQVLLSLIVIYIIFCSANMLSEGEGNATGAISGGIIGVTASALCMLGSGVVVGIYETSAEDGNMKSYYIIMCSIIAVLLIVTLILRRISRRTIYKKLRINRAKIKKGEDL